MEILKKLKAFIKSIFVEAVAKEIERPPQKKSVQAFYERYKRYEKRSNNEELMHVALEVTAWYNKDTGEIAHYDTCIVKNPDNLLIDLLRTVRMDSERIDSVMRESGEVNIFSGRKNIEKLDLDGKSDEEIKEILKQRNSDLLDD